MMHTTDTPLRPQERALALRQAIESIRAMPMGSGARAVALDVLRNALTDVTAGGVIVFKPLCRRYGSEEWMIHRADEPPRTYACSLAGVTVAWLAIKEQGHAPTLRTADFAAPGARQPDTVVRTAIRTTALPWIERNTGCAALVTAMRRIRVERGLVRYAPAADSPSFDTGD